MRKPVMLIITLAAAALFVQPTLADDAHQHEKGAGAAQEQIIKPSEKMSDHESMMQESMNKMHDQMESIKRATDPDERRKLLQEHSESMRESIRMMREMVGGMAMGGMGGCHMMHGQSAGHHAAGHSQPEQITPSKKNTNKPGRQLWDCPMHPEVVQDHPGVCPKCGMDLVKKGQAAAAKSGHNHKMDGCMMGSGKKGGCKKGGCKKGSCREGGGMKPGLAEKRINMMLMLMEQMIEHNDAAMVLQK